MIDGPRGYCRRLAHNPGINVDPFTWLTVGIIAGLVASAAVGGFEQSRTGDIVVGVVGALGGGWLFHALGIGLPIGGPAGNVVVAFNRGRSATRSVPVAPPRPVDRVATAPVLQILRRGFR